MNDATSPGLVLYAEDDENDAFLIRHCWKREGIPGELKIVTDGQRAIDYLEGSGPFADRRQHPLPRLVLLDLNMPQVGGMDVLRWVRTQPQFTTLPVAILSSSNQKKDIDTAEALGADRYFVKPANVTGLLQVVHTLHETWLR